MCEVAQLQHHHISVALSRFMVGRSVEFRGARRGGTRENASSELCHPGFSDVDSLL